MFEYNEHRTTTTNKKNEKQFNGSSFDRCTSIPWPHMHFHACHTNKKQKKKNPSLNHLKWGVFVNRIIKIHWEYGFAFQFTARAIDTANNHNCWKWVWLRSVNGQWIRVHLLRVYTLTHTSISWKSDADYLFSHTNEIARASSQNDDGKRWQRCYAWAINDRDFGEEVISLRRMATASQLFRWLLHGGASGWERLRWRSGQTLRRMRAWEFHL